MQDIGDAPGPSSPHPLAVSKAMMRSPHLPGPSNLPGPSHLPGDIGDDVDMAGDDVD